MPSFSAGEASIKVKPSFRDFVADTEAELRRMDFRVDVDMGIDTTAARAEVDAFRAEAGRNVGFRLDADTRTAADEIAALRREASRNASMRIDADTARALAEIEALRRAASRGATFTPRLGGGAARSDASKLAGDLKSALTLQAKVIGVVGGAGLVSDLLAVAGAAAKASRALALLPAVGFGGLAGIGSVAAGFKGIGGAFQALGKQTASSGGDAGEAIDKSNAVADAQYSLATADRAATSAQKDLNACYQEAGRSLRDLNDQLQDQKLSTEDAALGVQEAAKRLAQIQHDPSADADARRRADLSYREAVQRLKEQQEKTADLTKDTAVANAKGIDGSDQVTAAKQKVLEATHSQIQAEQALDKAQREQAKGSGSQSALAEAMAKLSPNAKELVNDIRALGPAWTDARLAAQDALTNGIGPAVTKLANEQLPGFKAGMVGIDSAINSGLRATLAGLSSETNKTDFKTSLTNVSTGFQNAAKGAAPLTDALTKLVTVGTDFLPRMGQSLDNFATKFDAKIQAGAASGSLKSWIQEGIDSAKVLFGILKDAGSSVASVFRAADAEGVSKSLRESTKSFADFLKSSEGQEKMRAFFKEAREDLDKIKPLLSDLPGILKGVYGGFQTWSGIAMPFLKAAADLLAAHPALVRDIVTAYLAFKVVGPIFDAVRGSLRLANDTMAGFRTGMGTTGTAGGSMRGALGGVTGFLGGPWGLAIAGGVTALGFLTAAHANASRAADDQKRKLQELQGTLDQSSGLATEQTLQDSAKELQDKGLFTRAKSFGIDPNTFLHAATGLDDKNKAAINDQLTRTIIERKGSTGGQWSDIKLWTGLSDEDIAKALQGVPDAVTKYADALKAARDKISQGGGDQSLSDLRDLKAALDTVGESASTLGSGLNGYATDTGTVAQRQRELNEAVNGSFTLTEKGRREFEQLGLAVINVPDSKTVLVNSTSDEQEAKLKELGVTVEHLPGGIVKLTLDDQRTREDIQKILTTPYEAKLRLLVDPVQISLDRSARQALHPGSGDNITVTGGNVGGRATGGLLPTTGPGTERRDGILAVTGAGMPVARVDGGEWVVNRDSSKKFGPELAAINAGTFRKLPGHEDGGVIGDDTDTTKTGNTSANTTPVSHIAPLISYAQAADGTPYGGAYDCSGFQSKLANVAVGRDADAGRFATANEETYLSALGFKDGVGNSSTFRIGWVNSAAMAAGGHTAGTLPNNVNVESGGATSKVMYGGPAIGAANTMFDHRAYLVMDSTGGGATQGAATYNTNSTSVLNPQANLPGRATDTDLTTAEDKAAVDTANSERNAVYANTASTDADRKAADIKYQKAQNTLEAATKKNDTSSLSLQGIFSKAGGYFASALLSGIGLENSIFSDSNVYNKAANSLYDHFNTGGTTGGYGYTPQNLPTVVTTSTPQSDAPVTDPSLAVQVPSADTTTADAGATANHTAGVERWRKPFANVLAVLGKPASWLEPGLSQIGTESGGDENAINDHDTDGHGGTQVVKGLMQELDDTYNAYRSAQFGGGIFNGASNIAAAVNYTAARYGDATAVWGHGHGYADGGSIVDGLIRGAGGSRGDGVPIWASPNEFVVNAYDATRNRDALEAINKGRWNPVSIDPSQLRGGGDSGNRGGTQYITNVNEPRVADVQDLADLVERRAHVQSMGQLAAVG